MNMGAALWSIIGAGGVVVLYLWYASIITRRNKVQEALSSVDVHLNQRHDLIPNIVALAGRYMEHERALLTDVTRLREEARKTAPTTPAEAGKRFALGGGPGQPTRPPGGRLETEPELQGRPPAGPD